MTRYMRGNVFMPGMPVVCVFQCGLVVEGHVHFEDGSRQIFICHDSPRRAGSESPQMYSHRFSWVFHYSEARDSFDQEVQDLTPIMANHKKITVSESLRNFLSLATTPCSLLILLSSRVKPFEQLCDYDLAAKPGHITIKGEVTTANGTFPKTVEIRLSRFLRTVSDNTAKAEGGRWLLEDKQIEAIHNELVAFQSGSLLEFEVLSGERILEGYTKENYSESGTATLHKSCMSGRLGLLEIYTKNPRVRLAVLRSPRGIEARCLLWETESGLYSDRAYYTHDWMAGAIHNKAREAGYTPIGEFESDSDGTAYLRVPLSNHRFDMYPFVDNFHFLGPDGALYATTDNSLLPKGRYKYLRSTSGDHENVTIE